ncbi:soluble lytic murein transglycosylase [Sporomusaceae bacterium BoRhaA]|nr:soluble lytic murein transglycosylase [Pelorhabdus rhamnosifermentans]
MGKMTWARFLMITLLVGMLGAYGVFQSTWFQKEYIYPFSYQTEVYRYSERNKLDPYLVAAVIRTESKFINMARSPKGAMGLMQMMPDTAEWVAQQIDYSNFEVAQLNDPEVSIRFGTWYLSSVKKEFGGNEVLMLAAYNAGRGNVKSWMKQYHWTADFQAVDQIPFKETREYVKQVLRDRQRYQILYQEGKP